MILNCKSKNLVSYNNFLIYVISFLIFNNSDPKRSERSNEQAVGPHVCVTEYILQTLQ